MSESYSEPIPEQRSLVGRLLWFCLTNRLVVALVLVAVVVAGLVVSPFDWRLGRLPRHRVAADAIPNIGENQQIVFTEWPGRSPQDVEDQVTYPLTVALQGVRGVRTIRGTSMFGFSSIYVVFEEDVPFDESRWNVLERLNSLPGGTLPAGVQPRLGPDATALGQVFWYTLEGRDPGGEPAGGWDLEELRTIQDWQVRYALQSAEGVSEVASVGGFVREYHVDVDPDAMRVHDVTLPEVVEAVAASNIDVGARTIELNRVEYFIRGIGFVEEIADIADSVVAVRDHVPVLVRHVATVSLGPALRRGALDKAGAEAVGGVVVVRYGENPLEVIVNVKRKIDEEIAPSLPTKVRIDPARASPEAIDRFARSHGFEPQTDGVSDHAAWVEALRATPRAEWPAGVTTSQVTVVPFYDRTELIHETLGTLEDALTHEVLVTIVVVVVMLMHLRSSVLIGGMLPLAVLLCFIAMKVFGVDANIVALSGIAIAIGTIVDMGIVICENILRHLDAAPPDAPRLEVIHRAASEVGGAVLTAVLTTVIGFLPVFFMVGSEGKLFRPLAFTKTFALIASIAIGLIALPPAAHLLFCGRIGSTGLRRSLYGLWVAAGVLVATVWVVWAGALLAALGGYYLIRSLLPPRGQRLAGRIASLMVAAWVAVVLAEVWEPLGPQRGTLRNVIFVVVLLGGLLGFFRLFQLAYPTVLRWCLRHKLLFLSAPAALLVLAAVIWLGFGTVFGWLPGAVDRLGGDADAVRSTVLWVRAEDAFEGLGREFMPPLDEGSFLLMPTTMVHASIGEAMDVLSKQDRAIRAIPEVDAVVGKIGRVDSPLDPAPISMVETVITYRPEYVSDAAGRRRTFAYDAQAGAFVRDDEGRLVPDEDGRPFRQWRDHIRSPDDIWEAIVDAADIPGTTSAPKLQPIAARIVMLQSGMRAPMGVKIKGPSLEATEDAGRAIESLLKQVPGVEPETVFADRIVAKPYLHIVPDRAALARYGVTMRTFQNVVEVAVGGRPLTQAFEGRRRFAIRVRYQRELRDEIETLGRILIPAADGAQVPLIQLAGIDYHRGPQAIKSEDTFLTGYVVFDKKPGEAEVDVVERCRAYLRDQRDAGGLSLPDGVTYEFAGTYRNQVRARRTLAVILPLALLAIFVILYLQLRSAPATLMVFSAVFVAWAGGFLMIWLYGRPWFLDLTVFGVNLRDLFQIHPVNLSVAVWVGFLALFGIATDDGVIMSTYLRQSFSRRRTRSIDEIRDATVAAGVRRVRPCLMTSATTILALIPVLTSTGRGSDVMVPMAIPSFGGMLLVMVTMFTVPVLYCGLEESKLRAATRRADGAGL